MNNRTVYQGLGLLDFLAYYLPGTLVVFVIIVHNREFDLGFPDPTSLLHTTHEATYGQWVLWTGFFVITPYLVGQMLFPIGYLIDRGLFCRLPPRHFDLPQRRCGDWGRNMYCKMEDCCFAKCLFHATGRSTAAYNDLMIWRFRTLSRFARAMLLPTLLVAASLVVILIHPGQSFSGINTLAALGLLFVIMAALAGFWYRHKIYEIRWRTAVCVAAIEAGYDLARDPTGSKRTNA